MATPSTALLILIVARNEAAVLGHTLEGLRRCADSGDTIIVVDDRSSDGTADMAEKYGARVYRRPQPPPVPLPPRLCFRHRRGGRGGEAGVGGEVEVGKGAALKWWVQNTAEDMEACAGVVILDADSRVDAGFLNCVRAHLARGAPAVQGFVFPVEEERCTAGALAAYSELLEQKIDDQFRAALGWPVRLRGTGMGFRPDVLRAIAPKLRTQVEDVEMSLLLAARGLQVANAPEARVFDPKPPSAASAARQRARWLRGQIEVCRIYRRELLGLMFRGPWAWSLVGSLLLKPRSILIAAKTLLALGLAWCPPTPVRSLGLTVLALSLLADSIYYLAGLMLVDRPGVCLRRLLLAPGYGLMWCRAAALAALSPNVWLRAREP